MQFFDMLFKYVSLKKNVFNVYEVRREMISCRNAQMLMGTHALVDAFFGVVERRKVGAMATLWPPSAVVLYLVYLYLAVYSSSVSVLHLPYSITPSFLLSIPQSFFFYIFLFFQSFLYLFIS